jgi:sulfofructose kinase
VALYAPTAESIDVDPRQTAAELVVVTRGAQGCTAYTQAGDVVEAPAAAFDGLVSTLGAGDVFHGALLAALVREQPLADALDFANRAAALSCRALDGRSAIPTVEEVA